MADARRSCLARLFRVVASAAAAWCLCACAASTSDASSPAAADRTALERAAAAARRDSPAAVCFPDALWPKALPRMRLDDPAGNSPPPARVGAAEQQRLLRGRDAVPLYCRSLQPHDALPGAPPLDKAAQEARWYRSIAIAPHGPIIDVVARASSTVTFVQVNVFDTGERRSIVLDRAGRETGGATVPQGGRRATQPVLGSTSTPVEHGRSVDTRATMTEAIAVVPTTRDRVATARATCAAAAGDWAGIDDALSLLAPGPDVPAVATRVLLRSYAGSGPEAALARFQAMPVPLRRRLLSLGATELSPAAAARDGAYRIGYEQARTCEAWYPNHPSLTTSAPVAVSLDTGELLGDVR